MVAAGPAAGGRGEMGAQGPVGEGSVGASNRKKNKGLPEVPPPALTHVTIGRARLSSFPRVTGLRTPLYALSLLSVVLPGLCC